MSSRSACLRSWAVLPLSGLGIARPEAIEGGTHRLHRHYFGDIVRFLKRFFFISEDQRGIPETWNGLGSEIREQSFLGLVLARSFPRAFRLRIPKRCKGLHCFDHHLDESFLTSIFYLLVTFCFGTAENQPCEVCPLSVHRSARYISYYYYLPPGAKVEAETYLRTGLCLF